MRILVTGGNGRIGRALVEAATAAGHGVLSLDRSLPDAAPDGVRARICDVTAMGEVLDHVLDFGPDAAVHLAAWVDAGIVADHLTYRDNVAGSYNVLTAAAKAGAGRAIFGSSAQVYGFAGTGPGTLPVTEEHPLRPRNAYALSKIAGEASARYVTDRTGTEVLSFRIMGARPASRMAEEAEAMRRDPAAGRFLLWSRVDVRDVAGACLAALAAPSVAPGPYDIAGDRILMPETTHDLIARHCPHLDPSGAPAGRASVMTCAKAARVFGYTVRHPPLASGA